MKQLDLTQGSVPRVLLQFAVPFLLANLLQALYGGADLFVVGWYDDAAAVSAVAVGSQVMQTITGIILGLTTGVTVLIAMNTGARDYEKVARTIGTAAVSFLGLAVVLTAVMCLFHRQVTSLMHTPPEALTDTLHYVLICSLGIPFIMGYNVVCGILRGMGDSRSPLYFVGTACAINIVADFLLVGGLGMRAAGAAVATVLSQGISFGASLWFLYRRGFPFEFHRTHLRYDRPLTRRIVYLGAPIALQDALVNISFLVITVIVNQMGVIPSAAMGVVEKIIVFAMLPPTAIAAAVATMTAQNYGAANLLRMRRTLLSGAAMALAFGTVVFVYSQFLPGTLTGFFTSDASVIAMANGYLRGYSLDCVLVSVVFCVNSYFSGQGNSWFPMIHSMVATFLFRIPLSFLFGMLDPTDLRLMGWAPPLSTVVSVVICIWYLRRNTRRLQRRFGA